MFIVLMIIVAVWVATFAFIIFGDEMHRKHLLWYYCCEDYDLIPKEEK